MKALVTGMNGTVAPALAACLAQAGHRVIPWNRAQIPIDDPEAVRNLIGREQPDWFFHLATGPADWAELIARTCAERSVKLLFTSSVSVYSPAQTGPFSVDDPPKPDDDYGRHKLECEHRVTAAYLDARVVRLGWQIGTTPGGNHMVDYLDRTFREQGRIAAGARWFPACSFLPDTGSALVSVMEDLSAGLYHLDGNPGLSFHEIAGGLNRLRGDPWIVKASPTPVQNNRMVDPRVRVAPITGRLAL